MPSKKGAKRPAHRPRRTLEDLPPDWKEQILDMSAKGMSDVEIRGRLCTGGDLKGKFNHQLWDALKAREDEFSSTIQKGKVLCQSWWEAKGRDHLYHGKENVFETGAWYANMKNRFGWKDKTEIDGHESGLNKIANALQIIRKLDEKNGKSQKS